MNRRRFLQGILATALAPAIVRAESLMPILTPKLILPPQGEYVSYLFGEGNFFDIITYTGNGWSNTIKHNLPCQPRFILTKRRDAYSDWVVDKTDTTSLNFRDVVAEIQNRYKVNNGIGTVI